MAKLKVYLNENLSNTIARSLRKKGYDVISSHEVGIDTADDETQMAFAVSQERAILTENVSDFQRLHEEYERSGKVHFGIIFTTREDVWVVEKRLTKMLYTITAEEMRNQVRWLNDFK